MLFVVLAVFLDRWGTKKSDGLDDLIQTPGGLSFTTFLRCGTYAAVSSTPISFLKGTYLSVIVSDRSYLPLCGPLNTWVMFGVSGELLYVVLLKAFVIYRKIIWIAHADTTDPEVQSRFY